MDVRFVVVRVENSPLPYQRLKIGPNTRVGLSVYTAPDNIFLEGGGVKVYAIGF